MAEATPAAATGTAPTGTLTTTNNNGPLTVAQQTDPYQLWNSEQWFDNVRWTLTGTQVDSDFKAGLWWKDADAMKAATPAITRAADEWDQEVAKLQDTKATVRAKREALAGQNGVDAARTNSALDDADKSLDDRIEQLRPVANAMRNAVDIINRGAPQVDALWQAWENDRATAEKCHADTVAMTPIISNMARAMLQAADATQKPFASALKMPEISVPKTTTGTTSLSKDAINTINTPSVAAGTSAAPQAAHQASSVHTPGVVHGTVNPAHHAHQQTATQLGSTAGTVVSPGTLHKVTDPTLAGFGGPSFGGAGAAPGLPASAPPAAAGLGPVAPAGGAMPVAPMGGAAPAGFVGLGGAAGRVGGVTSAEEAENDIFGSPLFPTSEDEDGASRRSSRDDRRSTGGRGGAAPLIGGMPGGGRDMGRRGTEIRPGYANKPRQAGVAAGLLGRAAKDAEFGEGGAPTSTRRRRQTRQGGAVGETVQFLDEEAWQTDDPGAGVVKADEEQQPGPVARPTLPSPGL